VKWYKIRTQGALGRKMKFVLESRFQAKIEELGDISEV
jgi:hypothetical protein